ncbi:ABC transporter ATP-binding protein [bacterium]|nr:ABC transporter ATP-binding protein [bacterium]
MIEVAGLVKRYEDKVAVDGISFAVRPGEWGILAGPNGAGKTTTLKTLAALLAPTAGVVRVAGFDVSAEPVRVKRSIGYLSEDRLLFGFLSGLEYLHFIAASHGLGREDEKLRTHSLLGLLEMEPHQNALMETYSAGMLTRILLAGALLPDPPVLLLDEPTANLDPEAARLVRHVLRGLADRGRAILMSTHLLSSSEKTADRVIMMKDGRILRDDRIKDLFREFQEDNLESIYLKCIQATPEDRARRFLDGMK